MSRMSELSIEIQERLADGHAPASIARELNIPAHWVTEIAEEDAYLDYLATADAYADADAVAYGTR